MLPRKLIKIFNLEFDLFFFFLCRWYLSFVFFSSSNEQKPIKHIFSKFLSNENKKNENRSEEKIKKKEYLHQTQGFKRSINEFEDGFMNPSTFWVNMVYLKEDEEEILLRKNSNESLNHFTEPTSFFTNDVHWSKKEAKRNAIKPHPNHFSNFPQLNNFGKRKEMFFDEDPSSFNTQYSEADLILQSLEAFKKEELNQTASNSSKCFTYYFSSNKIFHQQITDKKKKFTLKEIQIKRNIENQKKNKLPKSKYILEQNNFQISDQRTLQLKKEENISSILSQEFLFPDCNDKDTNLRSSGVFGLIISI